MVSDFVERMRSMNRATAAAAEIDCIRAALAEAERKRDDAIVAVDLKDKELIFERGRRAQAERQRDEMHKDYLRIAKGHDDMHDQRDEARERLAEAERERDELRADGKQWAAKVPEATGAAMRELTRLNAHIARAEADLAKAERERDEAIRGGDACCDGYATENQQLSDRAERAEADLARWQHVYLHLRSLLGVDRGEMTDAQLWQATETALRTIKADLTAAQDGLLLLVRYADLPKVTIPYEDAEVINLAIKDAHIRREGIIGE